jgi:elongation factor Ts
MFSVKLQKPKNLTTPKPAKAGEIKMATITSSMVNELRQKTGSGMMDCKNALQESGGDLEKAVDILRKKGLAAAAKKSGRVASEGMVGVYSHMAGKIGVLVEVNAETDFVSQTEAFKNFVKDLCLHVTANKPSYLTPEEVPESILVREREIARDQALAAGKKPEFLDKIVEGKVSRYYDENCLLEQGYVKDPAKKVKDVLQELVAKLGENIRIRRFTRYEMGEGLEKKVDDFAAEVASKAGLSS